MPIDIIVCIKSVVRSAPRGVARRTPQNSELNPFDRPALEAALQLSEAMGGSVTALTMGPTVGAAALAEARAMGVDRAVLISDPALAESDTLVTARVLATGIRKIGAFDWVLFGTRTADSDTGQVGPQTAAVLGVPFLGGIQEARPADDGWRIRRALDDWEETWQVRPPAAGAIDPRAFAPRPVGLVGISRVYDQPAVRTWSLADLGLPPEEVGLSGSPTRVARLEQVRQKRTCRMIEGEPQQQAADLIQRLTHSGVMG